jgi:tryptophan synthase alpha chain
MMDGPTIQRAGTRALERGVRTRDVFRAAETVAGAGTQAVVMTYWNLIEHYGPDAFARDLAAAGGSGLITPDLTPDEAEVWLEVSDAHGLDRIFLVSPSSTDERLASTTAACRGWVYATAVMGVTGVRAQVSGAAPELVSRIRTVDPDIRVGVGIGIANGAQALQVTGYADAAIVGSALVKTLLDAEDAGTPDDLSGLRAVVADLATGIRSRTELAAAAPST